MIQFSKSATTVANVLSLTDLWQGQTVCFVCCNQSTSSTQPKKKKNPKVRKKDFSHITQTCCTNIKKLPSVQTTEEKFGLMFFAIPNVCTLLQDGSDVENSPLNLGLICYVIKPCRIFYTTKEFLVCFLLSLLPNTLFHSEFKIYLYLGFLIYEI